VLPRIGGVKIKIHALYTSSVFVNELHAPDISAVLQLRLLKLVGRESYDVRGFKKSCGCGTPHHVYQCTCT